MEAGIIAGVILAVLATTISNIGVNIQKYAFLREGLKAPAKRRPYIKQPRWWLGMSGVIGGALMSFGGFALAPQSVAAPIGTLSLVVNLLVAHFWLGEDISREDVWGTALILIGMGVAVGFNLQSNETYTIADIQQLFQRQIVLIYGLLVLGCLCVYMALKLKAEQVLRAYVQQLGEQLQDYVNMVRAAMALQSRLTSEDVQKLALHGPRAMRTVAPPDAVGPTENIAVQQKVRAMLGLPELDLGPRAPDRAELFDTPRQQLAREHALVGLAGQRLAPIAVQPIPALGAAAACARMRPTLPRRRLPGEQHPSDSDASTESSSCGVSPYGQRTPASYRSSGASSAAGSAPGRLLDWQDDSSDDELRRAAHAFPRKTRSTGAGLNTAELRQYRLHRARRHVAHRAWEEQQQKEAVGLRVSQAPARLSMMAVWTEAVEPTRASPRAGNRASPRAASAPTPHLSTSQVFTAEMNRTGSGHTVTVTTRQDTPARSLLLQRAPSLTASGPVFGPVPRATSTHASQAQRSLRSGSQAADATPAQQQQRTGHGGVAGVDLAGRARIVQAVQRGDFHYNAPDVSALIPSLSPRSKRGWLHIVGIPSTCTSPVRREPQEHRYHVSSSTAVNSEDSTGAGAGAGAAAPHMPGKVLSSDSIEVALELDSQGASKQARTSLARADGRYDEEAGGELSNTQRQQQQQQQQQQNMLDGDVVASLLSKPPKAYDRYARWHPLAYAGIAGLIGAQNTLFAKAVGEAITATFSGDSQAGEPLLYVFLICLFTTIAMQQHFLARGLQLFDVMNIMPAFQAHFVVVSVICGGVLYREFDNFSLLQWLLFPTGIFVCIVGVLMLSMRSTSKRRTAEEVRAIRHGEILQLQANREKGATHMEHDEAALRAELQARAPRVFRDNAAGRSPLAVPPLQLAAAGADSIPWAHMFMCGGAERWAATAAPTPDCSAGRPGMRAPETDSVLRMLAQCLSAHNEQATAWDQLAYPHGIQRSASLPVAVEQGYQRDEEQRRQAAWHVHSKRWGVLAPWVKKQYAREESTVLPLTGGVRARLELRRHVSADCQPTLREDSLPFTEAAQLALLHKRAADNLHALMLAQRAASECVHDGLELRPGWGAAIAPQPSRALQATA